MKKHIHKLATYTALILISSMPFSMGVLAVCRKNPSATAKAANAENNALDTKQKVLAEKNQQIVNEARDAVLGTQQALLTLEKKDPKAALTVLQDVSKKLDGILTKNPSLSLVTADVEVDIFEFEGDENLLKTKVKQADDLLDSGKLQGAREILANLASEMRVTTISIPLGTYPAAIKKAIAQIAASKPDEAAQDLDEVLSTLVEVTEIIPLPILRAEGLLTEASEFEHKEKMDKEKNRAEVLKYTDAAKEQLKIAELLGYGGKQDYQLLYTVIDDIKNTMHSEKSAAAWAKVKQTLTDLKSKIMPSNK